MDAASVTAWRRSYRQLRAIRPGGNNSLEKLPLQMAAVIEVLSTKAV